MKNLTLATIFAAISGFVVLWVAARALDPETGYRYFAAFWSVFFAGAGLVDGITHETTRAVASAAETGKRGAANPWRIGARLAAVVLVVVAVGGALLMGTVVPQSPGTATALLTIGLISYVFQAVLAGVLSGSHLWDRYAALFALDSGVRLVLAVVAWAAGWGLPVFLLITVIGAASWLTLLRREHLRVPVDVDRGLFVRRMVTAMVASGASAALITGFPAVINAAFPGAPVAAVINAVILTRAPVLVPLQRFQSALVVRFVEHRDRIYTALAMPIGAVLGLGAVGFVAAWAVGPLILRVAFSPEYAMGGVPLGVLTFASAFMGALMITGVAVLALERHGWYVAGWLTATAVAFGILFAAPVGAEGGGTVASISIALFAGPLAGALVHVAGLRRALR